MRAVTAAMGWILVQFNHCVFDAGGLLSKELFADLLESVIPECFYRESRRERKLDPRLKHSGVTLLG